MFNKENLPAVFPFVTGGHLVTLRRVSHMIESIVRREDESLERTQVIVSLIRPCVDFTPFLELQ